MAKKRKTIDRSLPASADRPDTPRELLADLRELIEATRAGVAQAVYSAQVLLYWQVGQRILSEILRHGRAAYGEEIVATVRVASAKNVTSGSTGKVRHSATALTLRAWSLSIDPNPDEFSPSQP